MTEYATQRPYIASYIIFRNSSGQVAFLLRGHTAWMNNHYSLPAGKVENDESFLACAVREAKEEVGVDVAVKDLTHVLTMHRHEQEQNEWIDVFFEAAHWQGKLINVEPQVHNQLSWFSLDKLPENMVPNVRYGLEQIAMGNKYCEYNWENK